MPEIIIDDLTGGLSTLGPSSMFANQCNQALNVEWFKTKCGERRLGHTAITLGGGLEDCSNIMWMHRHLPTANHTDAQLWVLGMNGSTPVMAYKDTTWHAVTISDALATGSQGQEQISAVSFHGKLFIAYNSNVDRLHVWDGSSLRRTGMGTPAAPTAAETGAGAIDDTRTYRVRYTVQSGGVTLRRSEPSAELEFVPTAASGVTVTKPATISESETHWEIEATKLDGLWYVIATLAVGTTTYDDTIADGISYSTVGELAPDIGDYTNIPSVRYLSVDNDRLMFAGSFEDEDLSSRVGWTPVGNADGVGNDERMELDTDPFVDLDVLVGGPITGISRRVNGYVYVTKTSTIYQGIRTRDRSRAYDFVTITEQRGALPGTLVEGLDNRGRASLYALDPDVGPIRMGGESGGVQTCGNDLIELWRLYGGTVSTLESTTQTGAFYRKKKQVMWNLPLGVRLVLHTQHMREDETDGFRSGWALWVLSGQQDAPMIMFDDNIQSGAARSTELVPFTGMSIGGTDAQIWMGESGQFDNNEPFTATIVSRHQVPSQFTNDFGVKEVTLFGLSNDEAVATITVGGLRADNTEITDSEDIDFSGVAPQFFYEEGHAVRRLDNLSISELNTFYVKISDVLEDGDSISHKWGINAIILTVSSGQSRSPNRRR